jgi:hypothetical protein
MPEHQTFLSMITGSFSTPPAEIGKPLRFLKTNAPGSHRQTCTDAQKAGGTGDRSIPSTGSMR